MSFSGKHTLGRTDDKSIFPVLKLLSCRWHPAVLNTLSRSTVIDIENSTLAPGAGRRIEEVCYSELINSDLQSSTTDTHNN